jgi:uncharacterized protein with LGFP repeats
MREAEALGAAMRFEAGGIFAWEGAPAIVLRATDALFAHWLAAGAARSPYGWPTAPPERTPDGAARALWCTRGVVIDHPRLGAHGVHGAIGSAWLENAGELGHPIADAAPIEGDAPGSVSQRFERGGLAWSPGAGVSRLP